VEDPDRSALESARPAVQLQPEEFVGGTGLIVWNFYFRLYSGKIKKQQVLDILQFPSPTPASATAGGAGRMPAHRSRVVQGYIASLDG